MPTQLDERSIRKEIEEREERIQVSEDWLTPSGRYRKAPMFCAQIENAHLGLSKVVKAKTPDEATQKARVQLAQWGKRELRERLAEGKEDLRERAEEMTSQAEAELQALREILSVTLEVDDRIDWESLLDQRPFQPLPFSPQSPPEEPLRSFVAWLWPPLWKRTVADYQAALERHRSQEAKRSAEHEKRQARVRTDFEGAKARKNESIRQFQLSFESGDPQAIEEYTSMVFERSAYPSRLTPEVVARFDSSSRSLIADVTVAGPSEVSDISGYKFVNRTRQIEPVRIKPKEFEEVYDDSVKKVCLRTVHEIFESVYTSHVDRVVANIWTTIIDKATGHDLTSCILSVSATREEFESLNLSRVDSTECIKKLKGLIAGPLSHVAPVQPIMTFNRDDPRFTESREMLAELNSLSNLAEIPWVEFEHLVRELFAKMFSGDGSEVKVTRSTQDGGVDAIVFDPDPIRGGKFVIQAKRYTKPVPVSAVRDLYGTMLNEGAAKGLLVTTAHFGAQAREFAKDKPISLIDGSNLVYLLEQHGHKVRIDVAEARQRR